MDQVKEYLAIARKQHFWILCGLAALIGLIFYLKGSSTMGNYYSSQKKKFEGTAQGLAPLENGPQPNPEWIRKTNDKTRELKGKVTKAWEDLYTTQQEILVWPANLFGPDFVAAFSQPASQDDPTTMRELCQRYQINVKTELRQLANLVDAYWTEETGSGGNVHHAGRLPQAAAAEGEAGGPDRTYAVVWRTEDEKRLQDDYDWIDPPTPMDVRYAQEEIWVMEALCKSIARANIASDGRPAAGAYEAVVREIDSMLVGYNAVSKFPGGEGENRIIRPSKRAAAGQPNQPMPMRGGPMGGPDAVAFEPKRPIRHKGQGESDYTPGPSMGPHGRHGGTQGGMGGIPGGIPGGMGGAPGAEAPTNPDDVLKEGRYVDGNGAALHFNATPPFPEYNLMAFKLTVVVDEQHWDRLLIELCNSALPLEVREVRLNPSTQSGGGAGDRPMAQHGAGNLENGESGVLHNVTLEIHGVAYLISPVGIKAEGGDAAAAANSATAPAGSVPTPAPATGTGAVAPAAGTAPPAAVPTPAPAPGVPGGANGATPPAAKSPPAPSPAGPVSPASPGSPAAPVPPAGRPPAARPK